MARSKLIKSLLPKKSPKNRADGKTTIKTKEVKQEVILGNNYQKLAIDTYALSAKINFKALSALDTFLNKLNRADGKVDFLLIKQIDINLRAIEVASKAQKHITDHLIGDKKWVVQCKN